MKTDQIECVLYYIEDKINNVNTVYPRILQVQL